MRDGKETALNSEVILWILSNNKYDKLQDIKSCNTLIDLASQDDDILTVKKMAESMGVKTENIFENRDDSLVNLEKSNENIRKVIKATED